MTLLSFGQLFDRGEYPGPALLGMLLAGIVAAGARRLGIGTGLTLLGSAAGLLWYVILIFQARHTFYGLPTMSSLAGLRRSVENAYEASLVDYAPVPVRPGYVMLTVAALWIATTLGEVATFRWRRPLIASAPCIGLFAFVSIVGTRTGTTLVVIVFLTALLSFWAVESSHRLRSWGRWVAGLGGRGSGEAAEVSSRLARRMGGACLAAALVAPAFLPALGDGLLSWRSGVAGEGGLFGVGGGGGEIDLLASLQPTLLNQSSQELFYVNATRPSYWRLESLTTFDGSTWRPLEGSTDEPASAGIATEGQPRLYNLQEQKFKIVSLEGESLPAAVQAVRVAVTNPVDSRSDEDTSYDFRTGSLEMRGGVVPNLEYEVTSFVPDITYKELRAARVGTADPIYQQTPGVSPEVAELLERWTGDERTPADKLLAIQSRLRQFFTYSTEVDPLASSDYLARFLLETRTGYCQQFAAAFALLARQLGFPARVSVGFLPGETTVSAPGRFIVRGTHAHSWPEVFFEGYGWVPFEPTPRDLAAPPVYTSPPVARFQANNPFSDIPGGRNGRNPQFLDGNQNVPTGGREVRRGAEPPNGAGLAQRYAWQETFANLVTGLLIVLFVTMLSIPLLKAMRTSLAYRSASGSNDAVGAAFRHFEREATDLAFARNPSESASAFARRMAAQYRVPKQSVTRLAGLYERAEYGPTALSENLAGEARRLAVALRNQLWSSATWWARLRRLFSPRGLVVR